MFFSSCGSPNWHHATATSPSKTSAAWALPSRTSRSFNARLASYENSFSAWKVWNHVHQQPPHTPLCRSARSANASHVSGVRGRTARVAAACPVTGHSLKPPEPCQAQAALPTLAQPRVMSRRMPSSTGLALVDRGGQVLIGRFELVEPRLAVAALAPGNVCGEIFDVNLES